MKQRKISIIDVILITIMLTSLVLATTWIVDSTNFSTGTFNKTQDYTTYVGITNNDSEQKQ